MNYKMLLMVLACLPISFANAFTLSGSVTSGRVSWDNVMVSNGQQTLTTWSSVSGLTPTVKWRPGFMASPQIQSTVILSSGGNTVSFPITLAGIEYNTGSNAITDTISVPGANICEKNILMGNIIHLVGNWDCSYDKLINNGATKTPFFFLRPLLNIDDSAIARAFEGKPEGRYVGMFPVVIRYFYYSTTGAVTYRDVRKTFSVQLSYKPSYISSITITGSGRIEPVYDKIAKTVSGITSFEVNATGYFSKGLKMILPIRDYTLKSQTSDKKIPYSIDCICSAKIVNNGSLDSNNIILNPNPSKSNVDFSLDVHYDNIKAADVDTGQYRDSFTVLFEADF